MDSERCPYCKYATRQLYRLLDHIDRRHPLVGDLGWRTLIRARAASR